MAVDDMGDGVLQERVSRLSRELILPAMPNKVGYEVVPVHFCGGSCRMSVTEIISVGMPRGKLGILFKTRFAPVLPVALPLSW